MNRTFFLDLDPDQIRDYVFKNNQSKYRVTQILKWVYKKRVDMFSNCTDLPLEFRNNLDNKFYIHSLKLEKKVISAVDSSIKYLFRTEDNFEIITVFLPQLNRNSICLSTQIGCPVKCYCCASGKTEFRRNLTRGEILDQIMLVEKYEQKKVNSILFMGMGEPLLNYQNVISAIKSLTDQIQFGYSRKNIIVSTVGFVPQIKKLVKEKNNIRLALSLHAPDDTIREKIIKKNFPYSVKEILDAGLDYSRKTKSRLTIEYILISGINDDLITAAKLVKLIKKSANNTDRIQINLIPYNPISRNSLKTPDDLTIKKFKEYLVSNGLLTIIRQPKGLDICAGCGQLIF